MTKTFNIVYFYYRGDKRIRVAHGTGDDTNDIFSNETLEKVLNVTPENKELYVWIDGTEFYICKNEKKGNTNND